MIKRFTLLPLLLFLLHQHSYSQVFNLTHMGGIERGAGRTPNLTGASLIRAQGNYSYTIGTGDVFQIMDVTLPGLPIPKGSLANGEGGASFIRSNGMAISGNYAFVTSFGTNALEIIDITDKSKPTHKAVLFDGNGSAPFLKSAWGVAIVGNHAFITSPDANALEVVDISNPGRPVHKAALKFSGDLSYPIQLFIQGNYAYITHQHDIGNGVKGGLSVVDISDPSAPVLKGSISSGGGSVAPFLHYPYGITVRGNHVYTLNANVFPTISPTINAIEVFDVSNITNPTRIGGVQAGVNAPWLSSPYAIELSGNYAFVSNASTFTDATIGGPNSGFEVFDITNSAAPKHAGGIKERASSTAPGQGNFGTNRSMAMDNGKIYTVARNYSTMTIIDVNNPLTPQIIGMAIDGTGGVLLADPTSVTVSGNHAFVTASGYTGLSNEIDTGLEIIDISNPSQPKHSGSLPGGYPVGLALGGLGGNTAYIAHRFGSFSRMDVTDRAAPKNIAKFTLTDIPAFPNTQRYPNDIVIGNYFDGEWSFISFDNNGNTARGKSGIAIISPNATDVSSVKYLYDGNGSAPFLRGTSAIAIKDYSVYEYYLFVASTGSNALEIIDVRNPSNPVHAASLKHGEGGALLLSPTDVQIWGNYAYVTSAGSNALEIIDISNPFAPKHKSSIVNGPNVNLDYPYQVSIYQGVTALVACLNSGNIEVINILDPANPKRYQSLRKNAGGAMVDNTTGITTYGNYAYIVNDGDTESFSVAYLFGPDVLDINPKTGPVGTAVTISGQNFTTLLSASVDNVQGNVESVAAQSLTFTVADGSTIGKVSVKGNGQSFSSLTNFIVTPTAKAATNAQQKSFTANWTDVASLDYLLDVSTDNFTTFVDGYENKITGKVTSFDIPNANSATTYQYRVRSVDGTNKSSYSNVVIVLTLPGTPFAALPTTITQSGFTANWNTVTGATSYTIDVASDADFQNYVGNYHDFTVTGNSVAITGLNPFASYYYKVRAVNATGNSPASNVVDVQTVDPVPPNITNTATPNPTIVTLGSSPLLSATITDNVGLDSTKIFYRGISHSTFKQKDLIASVGNNFTITVQPDWYDSLGLEYYFYAKDVAGNKMNGETHFIQLNTPSISLPALPSGKGPSDYRIITNPYASLTGSPVANVYSNVPWDDNTKAGMWRWNTNAYDTYNSSSLIKPGDGYWVITASPVTPTLSNVSAPKYNRANLFSMTLKPGWNQVGNPYPVPISWDDVIAFNQTNGALGTLSLFNGGYTEAKGNVLVPAFQGGFVKNTASSDITIQIPFMGQTNNARIALPGSDLNEDNWNVFLHIEQNDRFNKLGGFGMNVNAKEGDDRYDNYNPPRFIDIPQIDFTNTTTKDVINTRDQYTWSFTASGVIGTLATIKWNNDINSSKDLLLLDEESLDIINMREVSEYSFVLTDKSKFRVFYGTEVTPIDVAVGKFYPNPVGDDGKSSLRLALPDSGSDYSVTTQFYNIQGIPVSTFVKRFTPGIHSIDFDLSDQANGVIIYKLTVVNEHTSTVHAGKIIKP